MAKNLGEVKQESPHLHLVLALHQDSSSLKARADVAIPSAEQWAEILSKLSYGREQPLSKDTYTPGMGIHTGPGTADHSTQS